MFLIPTLTGIPLIGTVLIYLIHNEKIRGLIIYITAALMMVTTFFMVATWIIDGQNTWRYYVDTVFVDHLMQIVEILLMIFIIYMSFKYKKKMGLSIVDLSNTFGFMGRVYDSFG